MLNSDRRHEFRHEITKCAFRGLIVGQFVGSDQTRRNPTKPD
jgi:hypothetical protein